MNSPQPLKLPEVEGWLASAIIRTLRQWYETLMDRTNGNGVFIVTKDDIDGLESHAKWLLESHRATVSVLTRDNIQFVIVDEPRWSN